jgi:cob(I)alamin adenosyltransferase
VPRIYTRTGDDGETGLFDGTRVAKSDPRVDAYGEVDELASWLGVIRARIDAPDIATMLDHLQRDLLALGAILADPRHRIAARVEKATLGDDDVRRLEGWIDHFDEEIPPLRRFILAGGSETSAMFHYARAICRRAERRMVGLGDVPSSPLIYINRLSDLLFTIARVVNQRAGVPEIEW